MKGVYWRAQRLPSWALTSVAALCAFSVFGAERCSGQTTPQGYEQRMEAARLAQRALERVGLARLRNGEPIDPLLDPAGSGVIGIEESPLTSNYGHLPAKRTSINPNYAAIVVQWLQSIGARPGDSVAVGVTGSFPALNVAVYAALEALQLQPIIVVSGSGSDYGATIPGLSWLDMEKEIYDANVWRIKSVAATLGGDQDRARLQPPGAREILTEAIAKNGAVFLDPDSLEESVESRINTIDAACSGCRLIAYVNVGGGEASLGPKGDRTRFQPGITLTPLTGLSGPSVAKFLLERGVPLIHVADVISLARRYDFPIEPLSEVPVGVGSVYVDLSPRRYFALGAIILIVLALFAITRLDFVHRVSGGATRDDADQKSPQQMV